MVKQVDERIEKFIEKVKAKGTSATGLQNWQVV
jgi:hypothetical protein